MATTYLNTIPKTFRLAGTTWKVDEVEHMNNLGETHINQALIKVDKNLPSDVKFQTFLHELGHAILYTMGESEHDERKIDGYAHLLHQFLITAK